MQNNEKLRNAISKWLVKNELSRDTKFYTREEWTARKEPYIQDAELVLVFEGALYDLIYGSTAYSVKMYAQLERMARRYGYYFEFGHAWNMGFYPLPPRYAGPEARVSADRS